MVWFSPEEEGESCKNVLKFRTDRFLALKKPEEALLQFLQDFYIQYSKAPSLRTVSDHADNMRDPDLRKLVDNVELETFYKGADFDSLVEREVKSQGITQVTSVCKEAIEMAIKGKSLEDAVGHLFTTIQVPASSADNSVPPGMKEARTQIIATYEERKTNPRNSYGVMLGYGVIDQSTAGIRKQQLHLHAAFPGHLKSTMIMNYTVNSAVDYGWNGAIFSSEMPKKDVMLGMVCIHSAHRKFNGVHRPLSAFRTRLGKLDQAEEDFLRVVYDDLVNNDQHGSIRIFDSSEFSTFGSIMQLVIRENQKQEMDVAWIDYITRLPVDAKYAKMQLTEARNETIADAKRFCMGFNKGQGIALGSAFQTNREAFKGALENGGKYNKTALAQYNAAEKEADSITYTWFGDDERKLSEPKLGIMKSRWGEESTELTTLFIERDSRRVFDMTPGMKISGVPTQAQGGSSDVEL